MTVRMLTHRWLVWALVIACWSFCSSSRIPAATVHGASVEWLCLFSPIVVEAEVTSLNVTNQQQVDRYDVEQAAVVCKPTKVLKGKLAQKTIEFKFSAFGVAGKPGTKFLLFLDKAEPWQQVPWQVTHYINLDNPAEHLATGTAYTKEGKLLTKRKDILALVKKRLKMKLPSHNDSERIEGMANSLSIAAPGESAQHLWSGSATFLMVPPDPEFRKDFVKRYRAMIQAPVKAWDQSQFLYVGKALCALSYYRDKETDELLKKALTDERSQQFDISTPQGDGSVAVYPLRQFAYEAMKMAGHKLEQPKNFVSGFQVHVHRNGGGWSCKSATAPRP